MKIVFDTNVLVAEAIGSTRVEQLVRSCADARYRLLTCQYILDELEHVLLDKLAKSRRLARLESASVLDLNPYENVRIVSLSDFIDMMKAHGHL